MQDDVGGSVHYLDEARGCNLTLPPHAEVLNGVPLSNARTSLHLSLESWCSVVRIALPGYVWTSQRSMRGCSSKEVRPIPKYIAESRRLWCWGMHCFHCFF